MLWAGWPTLQAAQEAQYDLEHGKIPAQPHHEPEKGNTPAAEHSPLYIELLNWIDTKLDTEDGGAPYDENDDRIAIAREVDRILGNTDEDELDIAEWIDQHRQPLSAAKIARLAQLPGDTTKNTLRNIAEAPAAAAAVLEHLDAIAKTDEEAAYVLAVCKSGLTDGGVTVHDWAARLRWTPEWCGVKTSPGANTAPASTAKLENVPVLRMDATGALDLRDGGEPDATIESIVEHRIFFPFERVYEVVHLPHHGLVALSTSDELFIVTEAEYRSQVEAPAIRVKQEWNYEDNLNSDGIGTLAYITYLYGDVEIIFRVDDRDEDPQLYLAGKGPFPLDHLSSLPPDMATILADPPVKAAIAEDQQAALARDRKEHAAA